MEENPYASPTADAYLAPEFEGSEARPPRPLGVAILAILSMLSGLVVLIGFAVLIANTPVGRSGVLQASPLTLLLSAISAVVTIASGVGMWNGARWGWWLCAFLYVDGVLKTGEYLLMLARIGVASYGWEFLLNVVTVGIHVWIVSYLFRPYVLDFFRSAGLQKGRALFVLLVASLALMGLLHLVSWFDPTSDVRLF